MKVPRKEKAVRSSWSGALSLGLVTILIKLYNAATDKGLQFKLLDKHGNCPISYIRVCRVNHREVPAEDIVKGYEYKKGDYVVLDEKDFKKAAQTKTGVVEILQFSEESEIDPQYYEKPYYVVPEKKSVKAYMLLRDSLKKAGKVAIVQFTMKDRQHIASLRVHGPYLMLIQLRYADEIKSPSELTMPKGGAYTAKEMKAADALIKELTRKFDPTRYKDTYTEELGEVIEAKVKGRKIKAKAPAKAPIPTDMKDLMRMLEKSIRYELKAGKAA